MTSSPAINWAAMERLRKQAKARSPALAHLSFMQRLDALAVSEFGVRNFHELQRRYEDAVDRLVVVDGGHHCTYCDMTFAGADPDERRRHVRVHRLREEAEHTLGFVPLHYRQREALKRRGYADTVPGEATTRRLGVLAILLAHYDRSLENAITAERWPRHPCFLEYLSGALPAATYLDASLRQAMVQEFGERPGVIPSGGTEWPGNIGVEVRGKAALDESLALRADILSAFKQAHAQSSLAAR